jgi:glycosyltransferase involved in cell wall biosynthesis
MSNNERYTVSNHTFVICAYQESQYLERCILSLMNQTRKSKVIIVTSTPNEYIYSLADKYKIEVYETGEPSNIAADWNFAFSKCETALVTIAHQDDEYEAMYLEKVLQNINEAKNPIIVFSNYGELRNERYIEKNQLLRIKRKLLFPLSFKKLQSLIFVRRIILSLGNPICCPSVTYVKNNVPKIPFEVGLNSNIDWQLWEKLSRKRGQFVYCKELLMYHRIHEKSTTSELIENGKREEEDLNILELFWPRPIALVVLRLYAKGQKSNKM